MMNDVYYLQLHQYSAGYFSRSDEDLGRRPINGQNKGEGGYGGLISDNTQTLIQLPLGDSHWPRFRGSEPWYEHRGFICQRGR